MSYRKEDLLSIAGELGLHCKGMEQEGIAAKVAAEVLKPEVMKASFLVADDQEVLALRQLFRENASMLQSMSGVLGVAERYGLSCFLQ